MARLDRAKLLREIEGNERFFANDGSVIDGLRGLPTALAEMSDDTFMSHANEEKNDFSNWVRDVCGDEKLARDLSTVKTKANAAKKAIARVAMLSK
jgi:hypothetical protein